MSRPSNPDNRYVFTCAVTGEKVKTNPKQFRELAAKYNITPGELDTSYVSRAGRRVIEASKLSVSEAVAKYNLHQNVAESLKCLNPTKVTPQKNKDSATAVEPKTIDAIESSDSEKTDEEETVVFVNTSDENEVDSAIVS